MLQGLLQHPAHMETMCSGGERALSNPASMIHINQQQHLHDSMTQQKGREVRTYALLSLHRRPKLCGSIEVEAKDDCADIFCGVGHDIPGSPPLNATSNDKYSLAVVQAKPAGHCTKRKTL